MVVCRNISKARISQPSSDRCMVGQSHYLSDGLMPGAGMAAVLFILPVGLAELLYVIYQATKPETSKPSTGAI